MQTFSKVFKDRRELSDRFFFISLICVVVSLPFVTLFNSYCIIVLAISWLLQGSFQEKFSRLRTNKLSLAYIGFYILHLVGLLYTTNIKAGMSDVETKLALFAFPLILSTARPLTKKQILLVLTWFVVTCIAAISICFGHAIYQYVVYHTTEYFYYHQLGSAIKIHAIYLAMYLNFAMAIIVYILATQWKILSIVIKYLLFVLIIYLFVGVIFLSSKIVILSIFLLLNIFIARLLWVKKGLAFSIILVSLLNIIGIIALTSIPYTKERLVSELDFNFDFMEKNEYDRPYTGFVLRVVMWKFSIDILNAEKQWLFGVGTGDGQDFLDQSYRDHHMYTGNFYLHDKGHLGYNTHNQYMQFLLSLGIVGLTYFLLLIALTFFLAFRHKKYLYLYFLFLFSIGATTESNLCTQKGVVFYGLFNSLFLFHSLQEEKRNKISVENYV